MKKIGVMLVGLCGRSGSGKGYVSAIFGEFGIPSIDTDAVYRDMTSPAAQLSPCMLELVARFGETILSPDNSLNRAAMRSLVFGGNTDALNDLNAITHKHILARTEEIAAELYNNGARIVLVDAPLLYESGFDAKCERVVCVSAPEETVIARIMKRDGISRDAAVQRLSTQISASDLSSRADYVIVNDCDKDTLIRRVKDCAEELNKIYEENYTQM
ncbi:MAG: dephospho-CoA kinase [Clostridia bacterium]|nr:dephospho-CoA kinase [Clostridia bacterium]